MIAAFIIACVLNKKYNPQGDLPFKYGYFLSVFSIFESIALAIFFIVDIYDKSYRPYYYRSEIITNIILLILGTTILLLGAILNAKKYKIGAILVSILTGNFIICIFYYAKRWNEFKKLPELKKYYTPNETNYQGENKINYESINYKDILIKNGLDEYISLFEDNRLNDLAIIMGLSEDDYEKLGIKIMGDRKRLLKIFSKNEIDDFYLEYLKVNNQNADVIEKPKEKNNILDGKTKIILKRNYATASMMRMDIRIDGEWYLFLNNNATELIILDNGSHSIMASFGYNDQGEAVNFTATGNDIVFNIFPKSMNEIIIEKEETIDENKSTVISENQSKEIEELEKLFDSTIDENEKGIIAEKLYNLGKLYYWRFIPRKKI